MTPILAKLDELKALCEAAPPEGEWPFHAGVRKEFRTAMPQLVDALKCAVGGLSSQHNHWHAEGESYLKNCNACESLTRIQAILEGK